jgi:hypothetical protein
LTKEKDLLWEQTKKAVDKKYGHQCIFERCISITESHQLKHDSPRTVDRCHIFSRSSYPKLIYNHNNIVPLARYIHHRMDSFCDPLYGEPCEINVTFYWWWRIKNHKIEKYNPEIDYEELLLEEIK